MKKLDMKLKNDDSYWSKNIEGYYNVPKIFERNLMQVLGSLCRWVTKSLVGPIYKNTEGEKNDKNNKKLEGDVAHKLKI